MAIGKTGATLNLEKLSIKFGNINIVHKMEFKKTVSKLNYLLHSKYQKNIVGY